jgi:4-hydroxybenzoate polyprenyltransferase
VLDLHSFDYTVDSVVRQSRSRALPRRGMRVRLQKLSTLIGAIAIIPVVLLALWTLALMLLARLIIVLVAAGFES